MISEAYRGMYKERYEGDSSFVKGLFLIKDYSIIERILSEEKSNRIFGNLTLLQMTYDKNYFAKIEELKYYQNLDLLINVYNRIAEIYKLQRDEDGEIMYKESLRLWEFYLISIGSYQQGELCILFKQSERYIRIIWKKSDRD